MSKMTNHENIPLSLAVWLANDDYDYDDTTISATQLMKPLRQIILPSRIKEPTPEDISARIASAMGNAIHNDIEHSWLDNYEENMKKLGYPKRVIDSVVINPDPKNVTEDDIPIYLERRGTKKLKGYTISGKLDFLAMGTLEDFKSTSTYKYTSTSGDRDYVLQGSIYRWLMPDIITDDILRINFIFTDWKKADSMRDPNYPKNKVARREFNLMPIAETEKWLKEKIDLIVKYQNAPEPDIPHCTDEELWRSDTVWKYFGKRENKRASKTFTDAASAYAHLQEKGKGVIDEVKGEVKACRYCAAFSACTQKDKYLREGMLKLD